MLLAASYSAPVESRDLELLLPQRRSEMAKGMLAEAPTLWKNGWPTTLARIAEFTPATILLWLVAPLGPEAVAVAGMGSFWVNVTGVSMVVGFGIGMIPLASQAYGAKNYERVGAILVRQQCIHLLVCTGVLVLWWNTETALDALDQPSFIASGTAEFVRWRMPALPFLVLNQNFSSFLQCQRIFKPMMYVGVVMNPISIFLFWLMISQLGMGTTGGALALTLSDALRALLNFCATRIYGHPQTLPNYRSATLWREVFDIEGIVELLKLSLPGALTVWSEWWAWECCVVMAGWLCASSSTTAAPSVEDECAPLAAQPILGNTMVLGFMVTFGVNTAACTQVGNYLGAVSAVCSRHSPQENYLRPRVCHCWDVMLATACTLILCPHGPCTLQGEPERAKSSAHAAAAMVSTLAVSAAALLLVLRRQWADMFSPDDDSAAALIVSCMPMVCVYIALDALGIGLLNSILRAVRHVVAMP